MAKKIRCPKQDKLKKNEVPLTDDERKQVMAAGATWHHGPGGAPSPAVWKSEIDGEIYYICQTHRATQCSKTIKAAIRSYDFIKTTAEVKSFNLTKIAGPRRIKDRGIKWDEAYHERSAKLKKRFEKDLGPRSYIRWEGHDYTTDSDYFIVVGPAVTKDLKKRFFAGIKKLPDDPKAPVYAPSGEYFENLHAAFSHASEKWAIPYPREAPNYDIYQLAAIKIPRHVKG
jgi:hypothetical protein